MMRKISLLLLLLSFLRAYSQSPSLMFVFLHKRANADELSREQLDKLMKGHMANISKLTNERKLLLAGPFDGGGGIFILNSNSVEEVKGWLEPDPGIQAKRWDIEILPYTVRYGKICRASTPYEMVTYHFVRYTSNITKYNVADAGTTWKDHDDYLKSIIKTGNVVNEGIFGERDGGVLILQGEVQSGVIESDPAILEGLFFIDYKKLQVAKGSFCEP